MLAQFLRPSISKKIELEHVPVLRYSLSRLPPPFKKKEEQTHEMATRNNTHTVLLFIVCIPPTLGYTVCFLYDQAYVNGIGRSKRVIYLRWRIHFRATN